MCVCTCIYYKDQRRIQFEFTTLHLIPWSWILNFTEPGERASVTLSPNLKAVVTGTYLLESWTFDLRHPSMLDSGPSLQHVSKFFFT